MLDPIFIPKKGLITKADRCLLYKKADGKRKKLKLEIHQKAFFFYFFNHSIPPSIIPLVKTEVHDDDLRIAFHCVVMSYLAYEDLKRIVLPNDILVVHQEYESDVTKIPFFICVDKEINSIIVACRGSSCSSDFITDSMGNGVIFDGGKIHQGIFHTAVYVFLKSQQKLIDLYSEYNGETIEHKSTCDFELSPKKRGEDQQNGESSSSNNDSSGITDQARSLSFDAFNMKKEKKMKIIFTGHSLGGGVAAVVSQFFNREYPKLEVQSICFAPPPTVSFELWKKTAHYVKSYMIEGDVVPFLSVQNVYKLSKILLPRASDKYIIKKMQKYLNKVASDEITETFVNEKLYPPGQSYLIRLPKTNPNKEKKDHTKMSKKEKKEIKKKNIINHKNIAIYQIYNPEYFSDFVKNIQEANHKCKNYMKVIIRLRQQQIQEEDCEIIKKKYLNRRKTSDFDETDESGVERLV